MKKVALRHEDYNFAPRRLRFHALELPSPFVWDWRSWGQIQETIRNWPLSYELPFKDFVKPFRCRFFLPKFIAFSALIHAVKLLN
jgi:hypothetical protein